MRPSLMRAIAAIVASAAAASSACVTVHVSDTALCAVRAVIQFGASFTLLYLQPALANLHPLCVVISVPLCEDIPILHQRKYGLPPVFPHKVPRKSHGTLPSVQSRLLPRFSLGKTW